MTLLRGIKLFSLSNLQIMFCIKKRTYPDEINLDAIKFVSAGYFLKNETFKQALRKKINDDVSMLKKMYQIFMQQSKRKRICQAPQQERKKGVNNMGYVLGAVIFGSAAVLLWGRR